ncbi:SDR family oxidoreductase [Roseiarcaceae bacterium H3SJ34-1]|uniref:SDR family oxidoreductase n=1 Tax=Terripilifer ovatus TaxID=3032367 RepID=UPI003AB97B5B|nr:SDR family oxidoreductase [Roseiarcaceae bacterium H3SJ34-1]
MDLGIAGRKALVCASSRGLGRACATALAEAGCEVIINGRDEAKLAAAADEIAKATGAKVIAVAGDVGSEAGRAALLAACPSADILVNNNSGPPPKDFRQLSRDAMVEGLDANMMTPILLVQQVIDGMIERRFGRIINITSGSVKMPMTGLDLSSGARAGLTSFLSGVARQVAESNVTINNILPGAFDTDRLKSAGAAQAKMRGVSYDDLQSARRQSIPAKRFGNPEEFGKLCAFLASAHAGYITGQNMLIDGGAYPSAF